MKLRLFALVAALVLCCAGNSRAAETVKIGVLAKDGPAKALQMWQETGVYLSGKLGGKTCEIVPLDFDKVLPAAKDGTVDFFITNSFQFVSTKNQFGATAVATMINSREGKALNSFGGVIITAAHNDAIKTLADLKGKKFMAVDKTSFGGWQMANKELLDNGIDSTKDLTLEFGGKHDNVVFAVQNEAVPAGTVRTDTLERMAAAGAISMDDFKIINKKNYPDFPFVCSTKLYPEWPLAKTAKTSDALAAEVVAALKGMKAEDKAAKDAKIVGWSDPQNYGVVDDLQKALKVSDLK
ncbi:MAG: hypothetical protein BWK76_15535 [Desulfobulbaceae bacterium A2]|nr:MAG: hypothetical protein BWK76_15535 [Desulfobulbaceae bacterium A2]